MLSSCVPTFFPVPAPGIRKCQLLEIHFFELHYNQGKIQCDTQKSERLFFRPGCNLNLMSCKITWGF